MGSKKTKPTGDLKKRQEPLGELTGVSDPGTFGQGYSGSDAGRRLVADLFRSVPERHEIEAELHPPIPNVLKYNALSLLLCWPATWMKPDPQGWSALHQEALELLIRRGLLEVRFHGRNATGCGVFVILSGPVSDELMAETFSTNAITADKFQVGEVRLSAEGHKARSMLKGGEAIGEVGEVVGFIFWDKLFGKVASVAQVEYEEELKQQQPSAVKPNESATGHETDAPPNIAPKGVPGRKTDPAKVEHAKRVNELLSQSPRPPLKSVAKTVNEEFNLKGAAAYTDEKIRELHRYHHGDKAQKEKRG